MLTYTGRVCGIVFWERRFRAVTRISDRFMIVKLINTFNDPLGSGLDIKFI